LSAPVVVAICGLVVLTACTVTTGHARGPVHRPAVNRTAAGRSAADRSTWRYVALGDSYTAGPLIPFTGITSGACLRSTNDYARVLARWLGTRRLVDVSCSGAATADMTSRQSTVTGPVPPQFDALTTGTDLVTVGIGGNDMSLFGSITRVCRRLKSADRRGNPCQRFFTVHGVDTLVREAGAVGTRVGKVVAGIRQRAPHAVVLVLGYPRITRASGVCRAHLFADADSRWSNRVEQALNRSIRAAVRRYGGHFVDLYPSTRGHDACAGARSWVNGPITDPFRAAAFHPYFTGMLNDAVQAYRAVVGTRPTSRQLRAARLTARQDQAVERMYAGSR
jgi:lysophospholipase L1-like esterase